MLHENLDIKKGTTLKKDCSNVRLQGFEPWTL